MGGGNSGNNGYKRIDLEYTKVLKVFLLLEMIIIKYNYLFIIL